MQIPCSVRIGVDSRRYHCDTVNVPMKSIHLLSGYREEIKADYAYFRFENLSHFLKVHIYTWY